MINNIKINEVATYKENVEINPTKINYFYGANGSGKTTLSNLLRDSNKYSTCSINWESESIDTLVYNREFIKENFSQNKSIKGIFTLGKDSKEITDIIEKLHEEREKISKEKEGNNKTLSSKEGDRKRIREEFNESCWDLKKDYENFFAPAFKGYISSKEKFSNKCISEYSTENKNILSEETIKEKCEKIFNKSLVKFKNFDVFTYNNLNELEQNDILKTKIVGKEDIDISLLM